MRHREAIAKLVEYASGALDEGTRAAMGAHVRECRECRGWIATHDLLSQRLQSSGASHPNSELVARHALSPDALSAADRQQVERHLGVCSSCRWESETARAAVVEARAAEPAAGAEAFTGAGGPARWKIAVAAGLAALAIGSIALLRRPGGAHEARIDREVLSGSRVIQADDSFTAGAVYLVSDADVVLRAGEVVALGNGFAVDSGANLTIEVSR